MTQKNTTVGVFGHDVDEPFEKDKIVLLQNDIMKHLDNALENGFTTFMFCCNNGFGLYAAKQILLKKKNFDNSDSKNLRLVAVIPNGEHTNNWTQSHRNEYFETLSECDECLVFNDRDNEFADSVKFIINHSDRLLCYYNGGDDISGYAWFYSKARKMDIVNLYR